LLPSRILAGKKATLGRRPGKKDRQGFVITKLKQRQLAQKSMMDCPKLNEWDSSAVAARAYGLDGLAGEQCGQISLGLWLCNILSAVRAGAAVLNSCRRVLPLTDADAPAAAQEHHLPHHHRAT